MKTKILFLIIPVMLGSCSKADNDSLCDCIESRIREQVKEIVDTIFRGCEEVDALKVTQFCYASPDFAYFFSGRKYDYDEFVDALTAIYAKMVSQDVTVIDEKIDVLDESTVVYSNNCTFLQNYRDQGTLLIDPVVMLFIFRKTGGKWTWIYGVESYGD